MANFQKSATSVSSTSTARLKQDYLRLLKDPVPYVKAVPLPTNILQWHYIVTGPENTPYEGGCYHGKLVFPREFPFKPPAIYMITPNGRFKVNQKLCLSISDYHPDTWNPAWSVSTILTGLLSFMVETTPTSGSMESNEATKRRLALESKEFNIQDKLFCELFPDQYQEIVDSLQRKKETDSNNENSSGQQTTSLSNGSNSNKETPTNNLIVNNNKANNWVINFFNNLIVMIGLALLAFVVKYVFSTVN